MTENNGYEEDELWLREFDELKGLAERANEVLDFLATAISEHMERLRALEHRVAILEKHK